MTVTVKGSILSKTFNVEWTIERFFADCEKIGDRYESPVLAISYPDKLAKWCLRIFPKGQIEESQDFVSLFLHFKHKKGSKVIVDYRLSLVSDQIHLAELDRRGMIFEGPDVSWGLNKFVNQDVLRDIKNDTLTILCQITFPQKTQTVAGKSSMYDNLLNNIETGFENYENLFESNYFSDVTFNVHDKKMYLHKAILASRSPVFQAMFEHDMKEKQQNCVDITDIDYRVMKELFRFLYSGKVNNIEDIVKDLFIAADKYSVTQLKLLCEKILYDNLTVDNAIEYIRLTDMYGTLHLKTLVTTFIVDHYEDIVGKSEFEDLHSSIMCEILRALALKKK